MHAKNYKIIILFFLETKSFKVSLFLDIQFLSFKVLMKNKFKGLSKDYYFTYT